MKNIFLISLASLILMSSCSNNKKETENDFISEENGLVVVPQISEAPRWVNDSESLFSIEEIDSLNILWERIYNLSSHIIMIHTIYDTEPYSNINDYTSAIDNAWADASNKYVIFIISDKLMQIRIVHGEVSEQIIPSNITNEILNQFVYPEFRNKKFYRGVCDAITEYEKILNSGL